VHALTGISRRSAEAMHIVTLCSQRLKECSSIYWVINKHALMTAAPLITLIPTEI